MQRSDMFLSKEELFDLTHRVRYSAQAQALRALGIEHRIRPDGSIAVLRSHIEKVFDAAVQTRRVAKQTPNFDLI